MTEFHQFKILPYFKRHRNKISRYQCYLSERLFCASLVLYYLSKDDNDHLAIS